MSRCGMVHPSLTRRPELVSPGPRALKNTAKLNAPLTRREVTLSTDKGLGDSHSPVRQGAW
jgi:hypothetical protein